jgi:nucleotide-binding universal stress UspA family protein
VPSSKQARTHIVDRDPHAARPADSAEHPDASGGTFSSVLCASDRTANDQEARRQAKLLASPVGTVELVSASRLTRHGHRMLHDSCEGHDLLALGAGSAAQTAVQHASIPILIARRCPPGTEVTDSILVPVDASPESSHAVELAGRLAAAHGGTVILLTAPRRDAVLQRAIAAGGRILLRATGAAPRVVGAQLARERTVPSAAATVTASLVVLGSAGSEVERSVTADIVGGVGCSVLVVFAGASARSTTRPDSSADAGSDPPPCARDGARCAASA